MKSIRAEIEMAGTNKCRLVGVAVDHARLSEWCAQFFLLRDGAVPQVTVSDEKKRISMHVVVSANASVGRAVFQFGAKGIDVTLSRNELDYWCSFFSTAYVRDRADVDHIDVEGSFESEEVELTLKFDRYQPPISAEQAKWRLKDV